MPKRATTFFTDKWLKKLKPAERRIRYPDADVEGLSIDVMLSGRKAWVVRWRVPGRRLARTIGDYPTLGLAEARREARRIISESERSQLDLEIGQQPFEDVARDYLRLYAKPKKRSWDQEERYIDRELVPQFGRRPIGEIKRAELQDYLADRAKGSASVARNLHSLLSIIFRFAVRRDLIDRSPMEGGAVPKPVPAPQAKRVLDAGEIRRIWRMWAAEGSLISAAGMLWTLTGCRKLEILGLRWSEVTLLGDDPAIEIPEERMKAGDPHRVPLPGAALSILEALQRVSVGGPWVFPGHGTAHHMASTQTAVKRWRKASGVDYWSPQTIRRSVATWLPALDVPNEIIDVVLAHKPSVRDVTRRNYNLYRYQPQVRDALTDLEAWLTDTVGSQLTWSPNSSFRRRGRSSGDAGERSEIARRAAKARWS